MARVNALAFSTFSMTLVLVPGCMSTPDPDSPEGRAVVTGDAFLDAWAAGDRDALIALTPTDTLVVSTSRTPYGATIDPMLDEGEISIVEPMRGHHDVLRGRIARGDVECVVFMRVIDDVIDIVAVLDLPIPNDDPDPVVAAYGNAWIAVDDDERMDFLHTAWADNGRYVDNTASVDGRDALHAHIDGFQAQFPFTSISTTSGVLHQGAFVHFGWDMRGPLGVPLMTGVDVAMRDIDGRLLLLAGFFDGF